MGRLGGACRPLHRRQGRVWGPGGGDSQGRVWVSVRHFVTSIPPGARPARWTGGKPFTFCFAKTAIFPTFMRKKIITRARHSLELIPFDFIGLNLGKRSQFSLCMALDGVVSHRPPSLTNPAIQIPHQELPEHWAKQFFYAHLCAEANRWEDGLRCFNGCVTKQSKKSAMLNRRVFSPHAMSAFLCNIGFF